MHVETNGFEIGDSVRDSITGFAGVIVGIHQYTTGCARASVQPRVGKDGKVPDSLGVDVLTLEMVKRGPRHEAPVKPARIGGPRDDPARSFPDARR